MSESKQKTIVFIESFQFCHLEKVSRSQSKQKTIAFIDSFKFSDLEKGPRSPTNRMVSAWKWRLVLHFSDTPATFKSGECWQKLSRHCQIQHVIIRDKLETWSWRRFEERKKNKQTDKQTKTPHRPSNEQIIRQKLPTDHPMNRLSDRFTAAQTLTTPSQSLAAFEGLWVTYCFWTSVSELRSPSCPLGFTARQRSSQRLVLKVYEWTALTFRSLREHASQALNAHL